MLSLYRLIPLVYCLLPIIAVPWAVRAARRRSIGGAPQSLAAVFLAGGLMGLVLTKIWGWLLGIRVPMGQTAVTMYWMTAILCLLAGINLVLNRWTRRALRGCVARSTSNARRRFFAVISGLVVAGKGLLMTFIGATVLAATLLSFRPRVIHGGTPASILGATFETIDFRATDGIRLRGWWIPSTAAGNSLRQTVLLCHGFGSDKANVLPLARDLLSSGFNVLAFDFRAHGESGGQLSTFGNIERRDVLGAVRWLKANRADQSRRILGLGVNMGAAALLAAASDPGVEGQSIEAIAAVDPFDDPGTWLGTLTEERVGPSAGFFVARVALPLAGAQCGVNLYNWSPANDAQDLWPRPLLVMHAGKDSLVPLSAGEALFDSAQQPKYHYWIDGETPRQMIYRDDLAARVVRVFFCRARTII